MNRVVYLIALCFLLSSLALGATITIQQPLAGTAINTGNNLTIQWTVSGTLGGTVKIILKRSNDSSFKQVIKESHPPTASPVTYQLPHALAQGQYFVRINYDGGFARSGDFNINPGLMFAHQKKVTVPQYGRPAAQKLPANLNVQVLDHAEIMTFKVNGVSSATNTNRINCYLQQSTACWVTAAGVPPLQYNYKINLLNPYDGGRHIVYDSGWISQSTHNIVISENTLYSKLFPDGVQGITIPVSVMGEVELQVRMVNQTANPAYKELPINFYL